MFRKGSHGKLSAEKLTRGTVDIGQMNKTGDAVDSDNEPKDYIKLIFEILSGSGGLGGGNTTFSYNNMSVAEILYDTFLNMQNDNSIFINTSENSVFAYENMSIAQIMYDTFFNL
mgnify:CR=1 FL=1